MRPGSLERLFDEPVQRALAEGLVSRHVSADGTLVRATASYKSFVPLEVALDPEPYKTSNAWPICAAPAAADVMTITSKAVPAANRTAGRRCGGPRRSRLPHVADERGIDLMLCQHPVNAQANPEANFR
jgi:hypothetical protein